MTDLASRLVQLRNGKARRAFAEQMGTTESTLRNYEKGVSSPTAEFLTNICQILRISPEWLLFGDTRGEDKGGRFFLPEALAMQMDSDGTAKNPVCPGCVALERALLQERQERQMLNEKNGELREQIGQLKERLKGRDRGGDSSATPDPMANTA